LVVDGASSANAFAFVAPEDSKELSADEVSGQRWYYDLGEAEAVAARTGKKIFVDFFATWCGPCKMLAAAVLDTDDFRNKMSKYFVFCRIDVDAQEGVAQHYGIDAMPTQMVLDKTGGVLGKTVGYGGPDAFYQFINQYTN
jgi:thioredoxin 1